MKPINSLRYSAYLSPLVPNVYNIITLGLAGAAGQLVLAALTRPN